MTRTLTTNPSGSPVAHGGNPPFGFNSLLKSGNPPTATVSQDRAGSPLTTINQK